MPNPAVSIVIPCFNAEAYLGEAIRSALAQTYANVETIVVDDGSTDGTRAVVAAFGGGIRYERQAHRGAPAARNRGISLASGELIQFLDADDLLFPDKLARQVEAMRPLLAGEVFCDGEAVDIESGEPVRRYFPRYTDTFEMCAFQAVQVTAPLHRKRNLLDVGGFREDLPCAQEKDLHLRLACNGVRFHHLPKVLFRVRRRRDSVSSSFVRVLDQYERIFVPLRRRMQEAGTLTDERARILAQVMVQAGRHYISRGEIAKGRRCIARGREWHASAGLGVYPPATRLLYHLGGPVVTQRLVDLKRRLFARRGGKGSS